jgi:hypothetical protein
MKFMIKSSSLLLLALPLLVQPLFGQVDTGTIAGTVRDSSAAAVGVPPSPPGTFQPELKGLHSPEATVNTIFRAYQRASTKLR